MFGDVHDVIHTDTTVTVLSSTERLKDQSKCAMMQGMALRTCLKR